MSLIEINIPDEEGWRDDFAGRILLVLLAGFLFRTGYFFWSGVSETGHIAAATGSFILFAIGVQLLIWAVTDIDLERWGRPIALGTVVVMTAMMIGILLVTGSEWIRRASTDVILFNSYSAELIAHNVNPYTSSMAPARMMWSEDMMTKFWTWRTDGSLVNSYSYPAGAALWLLPQYLIMGQEPIGLRLTVIMVVGALAALLVWMLPSHYAAAGPLSLLVTRNWWQTAAGGVIQALWVLPLAAAIWCWSDERYISAAGLVGVSAATKQFAWLCIPFLALWVIRETNWKTIIGTGAVGAGVFLGINSPFILANPQAWLEGVFTPLGSAGAPLVVEGSGLAAFYLAGFEFPRSVFTIAVATAGVSGLVLYWRYFERVKWVAWVIPPAILIFHDRSLMSYFTSFVPLATIAATAAWGRLRPLPTRVLASLEARTEVLRRA